MQNVATPRAAEEPPTPERISYLDELGIPLIDNFDVTAYINSRFPDETSLETSLEAYLESLQHAISRADAHLSDLVRAQSRQARNAAAPLRESEDAVATLQTRLTTLAQKAEDAELAARAAIEPARPLHSALRNTSAVRAALDALVRLEEGVAVLEAAAQSRSLDLLATDLAVFGTVREALNSLDELDDDTAAKAARAVKRLAALRTRASAATDALRAAVLQQFRAHAPAVAVSASDPVAAADAVETMQVVCAVGAAIGGDVRAELVAAHVTSRVAAFRAAFMADTTGLSGVERRFLWLRKELRANWAAQGAPNDRDWGLVFPAEWDVAGRLAKAVVAELRAWTESVLDKGGDKDVATMTAALGKSKGFEEELERRFGGQVRFEKAISESYGPWMGAYVEKEDAYLGEVVRELLKEETWACVDGTVLNSAKQLFLAVKKSMKMCAALDSRQPLYRLHNVFKKHLNTFAACMVKRLPGSYNNALADSANQTDFDDKIDRACAIISTADYCANTVQQLEENVAKIVDDSFTPDIDMNKERENYAAVAAKGVHSLVALLDEDLHYCLKPFKATDWTAWPSVGDTSAYVNNITKSVNHTVPDIRTKLSKHHFRFLLDKYSSAFIATFASHVYNTNNMSHFATQQILLDTSALRTLVVSLPTTGKSSSSQTRAPAATLYVKNVMREFAKIDAVLKVILSPVETSVDTYLALVPGGSVDAFRHILDMRGVRRADAAPLVLELSRRLGRTGVPLRPTPSGSGDIPLTISNSFRDRDLDGEPKTVRLAPRRTPTKPPSAPRPRATTPPPPQASGQASTSSAAVMTAMGAAVGSMSAGGAATAAAAAQASEVAVDSMKNFFGRFGNFGTSFKDAGIADRLGQVTSSIGNTTGMLTKEAVARLSGSGAGNSGNGNGNS